MIAGKVSPAFILLITLVVIYGDCCPSKLKSVTQSIGGRFKLKKKPDKADEAVVGSVRRGSATNPNTARRASLANPGCKNPFFPCTEQDMAGSAAKAAAGNPFLKDAFAVKKKPPPFDPKKVAAVAVGGAVVIGGGAAALGFAGRGNGGAGDKKSPAGSGTAPEPERRLEREERPPEPEENNRERPRKTDEDTEEEE